MRNVTIYTDGSYKNKFNTGGWAAHLTCGQHAKTISGGTINTTNNREELMAVIQALSILTEPCKVLIYSDSMYVINGLTKWVDGWIANNWMSKNKEIKNIDLWKQIMPLKEYHDISMKWVKGHNGNVGNELVDELAGQEADAIYKRNKK